ncbi:hypothetical protein MalM25_31830 [Planctomycetes bacterium MalM25]|nr:hypothetical protein MalM25_31830 [Planctomycetes bacterium MalM25]
MLGLRSLCLLAPLALVGFASAAQIDLRLDVQYSGASSSTGGSWTLYARTDEQGLFSLQAPLVGVAPTVNNELPRGRVNGSATVNAGFATFTSLGTPSGRDIIAGQVLAPSGQQQGVFYGVGTLSNGSPNFPGKPGGTSSLGPNITSLTGLQDSPWATDDPLWSTGVTVASGLFSVGETPGFGDDPSRFDGSLLTSIGDLSTPGARTLDVGFTTLVVTNLTFGTATGDYNADGRVDAADYTVWRDTSGQNVTPLTGADGNGDGLVNGADRLVWANNYGLVQAGSSAVAVPEPAAQMALLIGLMTLGTARRGGLGMRRQSGKSEQPGSVA